jgi:hypothetical protein
MLKRMTVVFLIAAQAKPPAQGVAKSERDLAEAKQQLLTIKEQVDALLPRFA